MDTQVGIVGMVRRALGLPVGDGVESQARMGRYGELLTQRLGSPYHSLADEGSYFVAGNPTPGTQIDHVTSAAISETAGNYLYLKNNDALGGKRLYLDFCRLICNSVPTTGSAGYFFWKVDNVNRYTSTGTTLTPVNANMDAGLASVAQLYVGANVTIAPSASARVVAHGMLRSVIPVAGDEWIFKFGGQDFSCASSLGGTVALRMPIPCAPLILGPQQNACLQIWFTSNNAAAKYEIELGWWER